MPHTLNPTLVRLESGPTHAYSSIRKQGVRVVPQKLMSTPDRIQNGTVYLSRTCLNNALRRPLRELFRDYDDTREFAWTTIVRLPEDVQPDMVEAAKPNSNDRHVDSAGQARPVSAPSSRIPLELSPR